LEDLYYWKKVNDRTIQDKISQLVDAIKQDPFKGIGKPEPLRHSLTGCWSRRITKEHRLVYRIENDKIMIIALRFHY